MGSETLWRFHVPGMLIGAMPTSTRHALSHPGRLDGDSFAERWELIAELDSGWGYEWGVFTVWRERPTGRFFYDCDAGCSCNGPYDSAEYSDLTEVQSLTSLRDEAQAWIDSDSSIDSSEKMTFMHQIFLAWTGKSFPAEKISSFNSGAGSG